MVLHVGVVRHHTTQLSSISIEPVLAAIVIEASEPVAAIAVVAVESLLIIIIVPLVVLSGVLRVVPIVALPIMTVLILMGPEVGCLIGMIHFLEVFLILSRGSSLLLLIFLIVGIVMVIKNGLSVMLEHIIVRVGQLMVRLGQVMLFLEGFA